jgi:hypothetical protein
VRRQALVLVMVAVIAVAGAAAVLADYSVQGMGTPGTPTQSASTQTPTSCTTTFSSGLPLGSGDNRTTFLMRPGSTALLCVTYAVDTSTMNQQNTTIQFQGTVDLVNATYTNSTNGEGSQVHYSFSPAPGVTDTAYPSSVTFEKGSDVTSLMVVFTISASEGSAGFYSLGYPINCPPLIPLAITDGGQKPTASDFPGFFLPLGCIDQQPLSDPQVTGLAGMNTTVVTS